MADTNTRPYRLKVGKKHKGAEPGDIVELTPKQAEAFADKFESPNAGDMSMKKPVGPTLEQWLKAGYKAENYPPDGFLENPTPVLTQFKKDGSLPKDSKDFPQQPPTRVAGVPPAPPADVAAAAAGSPEKAVEENSKPAGNKV